MTEKRKGNNGRRVSLTAGACLLAAALLLGCSKESLDAPGGKGSPVLVEFSVAGLEDMLPAAQGTPGTKAALANNTTVRVIAYKQASGNPLQANYVANQAYYWNGSKLVPCSVDANGNKRADVPSQMIIQAGVSYDFYAVTPALPLAEDNKAILATAVANGMDYAASVTADQTINPTTTTINLTTLDRKMAQVTLKVQNDTSSVDSPTLTVNSVTVSGLPAAKSGVEPGADIAASGTGNQSKTFASTDFSTSGVASTLKNGFCILPLSNATLNLSYDLQIDGEQKTVNGILDGATLEKGKSYILTAAFDRSEITVTIDDEWTENNRNNPDFCMGPSVIDGKIIVNSNKYGYFMDCHGPWASTPQHAESAWNANASGFNTVGERFEVATSNAVGKDGSSETMKWYEASGTTDASYNLNGYSACASYSQDGKTGWRLPTIRELRAIYDNKAQLTSANLPSSYNYWSATEIRSDSDNAWNVSFTGGLTSYYIKSNNYRVRCVRDL